MVEHNKKYTFRFGDTKIIFGKLSHESEFHLYAKVLAYTLYHKQYPTIRVEAKMDDRFQPDLSAVGYDGTMLFWAEVGNVSLPKIEKLFKKYRQAHFVFVRQEEEVAVFEKNLKRQLKDMLSLPLVDIVIYPEHFHEWNVSAEGDVYIPKEDVTVISWHDPGDRKKYY